MTKRQQTLADFAIAIGGHGVEVIRADTIDFWLGGSPAMAYLRQGGSRIRGSVFLQPDPSDAEAAREWVTRQPQPQSGVLECFATGHDSAPYGLRVLFERSLNHLDWASDPLLDDAVDYAKAWREQEDLGELVNAETLVVPGDPRDAEPTNGWLLTGTEASFPSPEELREARNLADGGVFEYLWTTAKQTVVGDLALIYFLRPRKAVHFVTRAASGAFFDRSIPVAADGEVKNEQWWAYFTPPLEIEPIPLDTLRERANGYLPLRGRSGRFLRPDLIAGLPIRAKRSEDQAALNRVLKVPVGRADLPTPEKVTIDQWPHLASGALLLEEDVSLYVVEPLLRFALDGTDLTWRREYPVGRRRADYVVLDHHGQPRCVIEVKLAIRQARDDVWANSLDFVQMRDYATSLGCAGILIDANRLLLVAPGADTPHLIIERRHVTNNWLDAIRRHLVA